MTKQKSTRKLNSWDMALKHILVYKLKITKKPKMVITVDKVIKFGEDYLLNKFPDNMNIRDGVIKSLNRLVKYGFLLKSKSGSIPSYKLNQSYNQPKYFTMNRMGKNVRLGDCSIELFEGQFYAITPNHYRVKLAEGIN